MDNEKIKLVLAIWGAVLSTILALMKIFQDRKEAIPKLFIDCQENVVNETSSISILIANTWKRPVTIINFSFGIGTDENYQKQIFSYTFNPMLKLQESEPFKIDIEKKNFIDGAKELSNDDFMFARLWINIKLTSGKVIKKTVYFDPKAYNVSMHPKYDEFLVTAELFKRDVIDDYNRIWTRKMKYEKR